MTSGVAKETSPPADSGRGVTVGGGRGVDRGDEEEVVFTWTCGERLSCHVDFVDDVIDDEDDDTPLKSGRVRFNHGSREFQY